MGSVTQELLAQVFHSLELFNRFVYLKSNCFAVSKEEKNIFNLFIFIFFFKEGGASFHNLNFAKNFFAVNIF